MKQKMTMELLLWKWFLACENFFVFFKPFAAVHQLKSGSPKKTYGKPSNYSNILTVRTPEIILNWRSQILAINSNSHILKKKGFLIVRTQQISQRNRSEFCRKVAVYRHCLAVNSGGYYFLTDIKAGTHLLTFYFPPQAVSYQFCAGLPCTVKVQDHLKYVCISSVWMFMICACLWSEEYHGCTCTTIKCFVTSKSTCCAQPTNMYFCNKFSMILKRLFAWYTVYLSYTHKWNILDGVVKTLNSCFIEYGSWSG